MVKILADVIIKISISTPLHSESVLGLPDASHSRPMDDGYYGRIGLLVVLVRSRGAMRLGHSGCYLGDRKKSD